MSKNQEKDIYLKQYPKAKKWLNECIICHTIGYKPELPDNISPGVLAQNIRKILTPLEVNEIGICEECYRHYKG